MCTKQECIRLKIKQKTRRKQVWKGSEIKCQTLIFFFKTFANKMFFMVEQNYSTFAEETYELWGQLKIHIFTEEPRSGDVHEALIYYSIKMVFKMVRAIFKGLPFESWLSQKFIELHLQIFDELAKSSFSFLPIQICKHRNKMKTISRQRRRERERETT